MSGPDPHLASALMLILEATIDRGTGDEDHEILQLAWDEVAERLAAGAGVNGVVSGEFGTPGSLLCHAIGWRRADIAELLLAHGARPTDPVSGHNGAYEAACNQPEMIRLLMRHGANPTLFDREDMAVATGADLIAEQTLPDDFPLHLFTARSGARNPHYSSNPFFLDQIRTFDSAYGGAKRHLPQGVSDYDLRPVFSFDRFGRTATRLPDGRLVLIAGEHEDSYDSNFCIYNDVCILDGKGGVDLILYPENEFPPTDFHTATLLDDHILLIGNLGYRKQRQEGVTQVLRLDLGSFRISEVATKGDNPGWICRHRADLEDGRILVSGGRVEPGYRGNAGRFELRLRDMVWRALD